MRSPFQFGKVVTGDAFTNRNKEIERLQSNFQNHVHTILISPRRWGKSSLVRKAANELALQDKSVRFCFLDLFNIRSEEEFYAYFAREVIKTTATKVEEWLTGVKKFFRAITPKVSMGGDPMHDFQISFDLNDIETYFAEILELPEKIAKDKNHKLIICIDEFQNLSNFSDPLVFQKRLRASWQHQQGVVYCLYGSKRSMLMELLDNSSMPFYKFGDTFYMEKISKKHWVKFIMEGFEKTKKKIGEEEAEKIIDLMQCHPYYVQQLAHLVWINTERKAGDETVEDSVENLLEQNALFFQKEVDGLSNTQINFLKALTDGVQEQLSSKKIINEYKLGTSANVVKIKNVLDKKEIIDTLGTVPVFLDPAFELWFKRYYHQ